MDTFERMEGKTVEHKICINKSGKAFEVLGNVNESFLVIYKRHDTDTIHCVFSTIDEILTLQMGLECIFCNGELVKIFRYNDDNMEQLKFENEYPAYLTRIVLKNSKGEVVASACAFR